VSGEADLTTQLAVEQADMIRGKRLRPLATVSDKPLELEGFGTIPPLSQTVPASARRPTTSASSSPRACPTTCQDGREDLGRRRQERALKKYATSRGALFNPLAGDAAQKAVFPAVQANAWNLHASGKTKVAPDTVGIPKP
jgi:hypothetical protein